MSILPTLPEESPLDYSPPNTEPLDSQATQLLVYPSPTEEDLVFIAMEREDEEKKHIALIEKPIEPYYYHTEFEPEHDSFPELSPAVSLTVPVVSPSPEILQTQSVTQPADNISTPPRRTTRSQTSSADIHPASIDIDYIETKYDEIDNPPKKTPTTRRKSKPIVEEPEYIVERIVGRYIFHGEYWYEVKWKDWPDQSNTLQQPQDIPPALRRAVVPPKINANQKKQIKAITELLKIHCNQFDGDEREVYARTWVDLSEIKDSYTRAFGVAKLHYTFWYVSNATEKRKAEAAEVKVATIFPKSEAFKCLQLVRPGEMPQYNEPELEDEEVHYEDPEEDAVIVISSLDDEKKEEELIWPDQILLNFQKKEAYPYPTESMDEVFRPSSDKKRKQDRKLFHRRFNPDDVVKEPLKELYQQSITEQKELNTFKLDNIAILDSEIHSISSVNSLSQICAVSLDGKKVFNRYIQHVIGGPYLQKEWLELVGDYVDMEPSDDPEKAESFPAVILQFCQFWPAGTLFLYKGHNDYSFLVLNFRTHFDLNTAQILEAIQMFSRAQYRFQSADKVLAMDSIPVKLRPKTTVAALDIVYKEIFYRSLLFSSELSSFVYDKEIRDALNEEFKLLLSPTFQGKYDRNPPPAWEKVDIWYWTSGNLGPVWHSAHTDALMLRNCLIAIMIYFLLGQKTVTTKLELPVIWKEIMTAIVAKTTVFREYHLGCSSTSAQLLASIVIEDAAAFDNSRYLAVRIHNSIMGGELNLEDENLETFASDFVPPVYTSPERGQAVFNATLGEKVKASDGHIQDKKADDLYSFQLFNDVMVSTANEFTESTSLKETLKLLIIEKGLKLEGEGSKLPKEFQFYRTDMQNYFDFLQNHKGVSAKDRRWFELHPCLTKAGTSSAVRFPKTYLLHHQDCPELNIKSKDTALSASQTTISINDFRKHPAYSYRFRFCKKCKKWKETKPDYEPNKYGLRAELKEEQEEASKLDQILLNQIRVKQEPVVHPISYPPPPQPPQIIQLQPIINVPPNVSRQSQQQQQQQKTPPKHKLVGLPRYRSR